jgi:hypothetical protein
MNGKGFKDFSIPLPKFFYVLSRSPFTKHFLILIIVAASCLFCVLYLLYEISFYEPGTYQMSAVIYEMLSMCGGIITIAVLYETKYI